MKAMAIKEYGGPDQLVLTELPVPAPAAGEVLIRVKAFGINRAETYMRKGAWGKMAKVSGIECVGLVENDTTGSFPKGSTVAAIMGGMGRTRNGSYAEYTCVPATNVFALDTDLDWSELAAIPESYATAWSCLVHSLRLEKGQVLLVRGATSALGQAALNIAAQLGALTLATTRKEERAALLKSLGASRVLIETDTLSPAVRELYPDGVDAVLELLGNRTLLDSMRMARKAGRVCVAGFLGGAEAVPFDVLTGMAPGVDVSFYASFMLGTKDYPLSDIPMQEIVDDAARGTYKANPVKVMRFEQIPDAHRLVESNGAGGKIVVVV
jgi:NADPH:quinone reductase-like Zn-dependent oxidoreductase